MIVHLATSRRSLLEEIAALRTISETIKSQGHELAEEWIEPAHKNAINNVPTDLKKTYHQTMEEVAKAEVIIAEVTTSSFGIGYQVAAAIQQRKPVLLLMREGAPVNTLVKGLDNKVVIYREYNKTNLKKIVEKYLEENDVQAKDLRFNFYIDRKTFNYLRWTSQKTGKTKARILRELIERQTD